MDNYETKNDVEAAQRKRQRTLSELLSTEECYIQDLAQIVNGYMAEIRNHKSNIPEDLKSGKTRLIFGNIQAIYEWHRDHFLKNLRKCIKTPSELGPMIKKYERKFHMYVDYCQNKPISEHIVSQHFIYFDQIRKKLNHSLDLSDLLIKPVQRITKYELFLSEIKNQTERTNLTEELPSMKIACNVMKVVCRAVNDMMIVRLQKFEGQITAQGKLLLDGPLWCVKEQTNHIRKSAKPRKLQAFLFEQSIILAEIVGKKTKFKIPLYVYWAHLEVNKMDLHEIPNNRFVLKSTDPKRSDLYICNAATADENEKWLKAIKKVLQKLINMRNAIQRPMHYRDQLIDDS